jgi:hypothetical protein
MGGSMLLLLAACGGGAHLFRTDGVTLQVPAGWHISTRPLNEVSDPVQRFVLSSVPVPPDASRGNGYLPPENAVLAQVLEEEPADYSSPWPRRPAHFKIGRLGRVETLDGRRWGELLFRDHGRHFYVFAWVGRHASSAQVAAVLRALDGLQVRAP